MGEPRREDSSYTLKSGFTYRSCLGLLYAIFVFQPALLWAYLGTGNTALFGLVMWATVIFFAEIARLGGKPLTIQEAAVIFASSNIVGSVLIPLNWIYATYFRNSPAASAFGLKDMVPDWYSPPQTEAWEIRTLFSPYFHMPILIGIISMMIYLFANFSLALIARQLYVEGERLPFPIEQAGAEAVKTLVERDPDRLTIFALSTFGAAIYSSILFTSPLVGQSLGYFFTIIPTPWTDYNYYVHAVLPGASLGISTDPLMFVLGFIVPFSVCASMFLGSFALYFIGNWLLVQYGFTLFAQEWRFNMSVATSWQRSILYTWASPILGIVLAAGILPLIRHPRSLIETIRTLGGLSKKERPVVSLWLVIAGFFGSAIVSVILTYWLVPDFPTWFSLLISIGWSLLFTVVCTRAYGITGTYITIPSVNYFFYYATGYEGTSMWFNTVLYIGDYSGGPLNAANFKLVDLCRCEAKSFMKTWLLIFPITVIIGIIYVEQFWRIAPIPSEVYPGADAFWPVTANFQALWTTRSLKVFQPFWIALGFVATAALFLLFEFLPIPLSMIAVATGCTTAIPITLSMLVGATAARILRRRYRWFEQYRTVIVAGVATGESIMLVIGAAISMIIKSLWVTLY